jgi:hypothetical protein
MGGDIARRTCILLAICRNDATQHGGAAGALPGNANARSRSGETRGVYDWRAAAAYRRAYFVTSSRR